VRTLAFGKKNKPPVETNPHEVAALGQKHEEQAAKDKNSSVYDHFHANEAAAAVEKAKRRRKLYAGILIGLVSILLIMYIISMLLTQWGDLVISIGDLYDGKTIMLCENGEFEDGVGVKLNGGSVENVTNITKDWLPKNLDTEKDGQHNGENYLAYTFYLKNTGDQDLEYNTKMTITGASKSADEAIRIMIYKNGKEEVYAKGTYNDREKAEEDATVFVDNETVLTTESSQLNAGSVDKFTVVIWVEGNDPQCLDPIRGGFVRSQMVFNVVPDVKE
jgi:hypothetical protein